MTIFQAIILGIVEGITEFLPISSTGHLILTSSLLRIPPSEFVKTFEIAIQFGAIFSVILLYFDKLIKNKLLWKQILISFIPTAILGVIFYKFIKTYLLGSPMVVVVSLVIGGVILILWEKNFKTKEKKSLANKDYLLIGLFQSISMIPGVSRAAATIIGGEAVGMSRNTSLEFSFLLAVPTLFAAAALDLVKSNLQFSSNEILLLVVGFIAAFITAYLTIKSLLSFVSKHDFSSFGIYRIVLGILFLLYYFR